MKTFDSSLLKSETLRELVRSLDCYAVNRYNFAAASSNFRCQCVTIGSFSAVLDKLAESLGALRMYGASFADDAETLRAYCAETLTRSQEIAALAEVDDIKIVEDSAARVEYWLQKSAEDDAKFEAMKAETTTTEDTTEDTTTETTTTEDTTEAKDHTTARTAFESVTDERREFDTIEAAAVYILTTGQAIREAVGYGFVAGDAEIDARHIKEHYSYSGGKFAVFFRALGTHGATTQHDCDTIREYWGSKVVGRLTVENTPAGYIVTRKTCSK